MPFDGRPISQLNFRIMTISYKARWKEMLDGLAGDQGFTVEMTMGTTHVYFPTEATWQLTAPNWAVGLWQQARDGAESWCASNSVAFTIDDSAWVDFHNIT